MQEEIIPIEQLQLVIPGIVVGFIAGYLLGGLGDIAIRSRGVLAMVLSVLGGILLSLILGFFVPISTSSVFLVILSVFGGIMFGAAMNWRTPKTLEKTSHVVFDPEEEEEHFEREIEHFFKSE